MPRTADYSDVQEHAGRITEAGYSPSLPDSLAFKLCRFLKLQGLKFHTKRRAGHLVFYSGQKGSLYDTLTEFLDNMTGDSDVLACDVCQLSTLRVYLSMQGKRTGKRYQLIDYRDGKAVIGVKTK
jgi:hypothetical protein